MAIHRPAIFGFVASVTVLGATVVHAEDLSPAREAPSVHAQLVPRQFTTLASVIPAEVEHISVRDGERFADRQVLVRLDCALQRAQLDEARASLAAAEKTRSVNRRLVELHSGGVLEADVATAEAAKARAKVQSAEVTLSKCTIPAPFGGRVVEQKAREHQYVQAGQPLLEILDDSVLEVEFIAPSSWLAWLKAGASLTAVTSTVRVYATLFTVPSLTMKPKES
ncbi:Efflux RND transporter periplasmic adaptor subunit [uncultured Gammaproteobacteria bacterium]